MTYQSWGVDDWWFSHNQCLWQHVVNTRPAPQSLVVLTCLRSLHSLRSTHTHTPTDRQFHNFTLIHTHACTLRCTHLNLTANDISMSSCNATHMTDTSQTILRTASSVDTMCRLIIYYINNIRIMTSFEWHLSTSCLTAVWAGILLGPFYGAIAVLCHMLSLSLWTSIRRRRVVRQ